MSKKLIPQVDLLPLHREAIKELHHYAALLCFQDGRTASGVFVNTGGIYGILTANHVAVPLLNGEKFGISIAEYPHALWVPNGHFEHVKIGEMPVDEDERCNGPDLSFIIIRDTNLLGTLKSKMSFCYLDSQDLSIFEKPLEHLAWGITGCPHKDRVVSDGGQNVGLYSFAGMAGFLNRKERNDFDFLQLRMPCDGEEYPADYEGLSGGGMWAITFKLNTDGQFEYLRPVLAGISFYQSAPDNGWRIVTGHGFDSIYRRVRNALKDKR